MKDALKKTWAITKIIGKNAWKPIHKGSLKVKGTVFKISWRDIKKIANLFKKN